MKVHELLTDESKWTKGWYAKTVDGNKVSVTDDAAARWCLFGAVWKCYRDPARMRTILSQVFADREREAIWWNDDPERTFDDVRDLVTRLDI